MTTLSLLVLLAAQGGIIAPGAHLTTPVAGLQRTGATASVVDAMGHGFAKALRVTLRQPSAETNATQLTLANAAPIEAGDVLMATVWLRGRRADGKAARVELLFEKAASPWTKSLTQGLALRDDWQEFDVPFRASESYAPGAAMLSLRLAFGPQTVEIAEPSLVSFGKSKGLDALVELAAARDPLGKVALSLDLAHPRQAMRGLGGNFCQPRYGATEPLDAVGRYALANLKVAHARVGLPLEKWTPEPGVYRDDAQTAASLGALREMARRGIPTVVSIWEGPKWMLGGAAEQSGRVLDPAKYDACIDAIAGYLALAHEKYGADPEYLSFNEPDYGVNFKFTPKTMADFIRKAGPKFAARGLATKFLVGDTAGGASAVAFDTPLLSDPAVARYLGPISFHCWDVLSAPDEAYTAIAALGKRSGRPVWCLEAGHDSALWDKKDPWATWDNALRTAMAYERTVRLAEPSRMDYWTYQDNYPMADKNGPKPYPVFGVMRQMEAVFASGSRIVRARGGPEGLQAIGSVTASGRVAMLLVNPRGKGQAVVSGLRPGARFALSTSDRAGTARRTTARADRLGRVPVSLPTRSVVAAVEVGA